MTPPTSLRRLMLRLVVLILFVVWVGGFTFYGAVVLPALHDAFGRAVAGGITQRITHPLNALGIVTLAGFSVLFWSDRKGQSLPRVRSLQLALFLLDVAIQLGLIVGHPVLDRALAAGSLPAFDPLHQVYLWASTVQWFVNLGLLSTTLRLWTEPTSLS